MSYNGWRETTIGGLCDEGVLHTQTGPFGSQLHSYDYVPKGVPVIPTEGIGRRHLLTDGIPEVTEATAARLARHRLMVGDILFARRGVQATGLTALVTQKQDGWLCGTGAILLRVKGKGIDPAFLSFLLSAEESVLWLKQHAVGAVMPNLNEGIIRSLPVRLPPIVKQYEIAAVLGALDDMIELNRRMNATLEAMARALFQSWFVDFDPVRAKLDGRSPPGIDFATLALFPAVFRDSALGRIPLGWSVGRIDDIGANPRNGVQPDEIAPNTPYIASDHMPRHCISLGDWDQAAEVASGKSTFVKGDILFGKLRPYFHKVGVAPLDGVCSTDILVLRPKSPEWFGFLLGHLSSDELIKFTDLASTGTKMPRTNWGDIGSFKVALPDKPIAEAFTRLTQPLLDRIDSNLHESRTLAALRDNLLPKLLSGELSVTDSAVREPREAAREASRQTADSRARATAG
jgi:type I restriction enzyme S subunit